MKIRALFVAVLALFVAVPATATGTLPADALRVERATIQPMKDPGGAFMLYVVVEGFGSQCQLMPGWDIKVTVNPEADGTYVRFGSRTGEGHDSCEFFVNQDIKVAWEAALQPYRQDHTVMLPINPGPGATFTTHDLGGAPIGRVEDLAPFAPGNVTVANFDRSTQTLTLDVNTSAVPQQIKLKLGQVFALKRKGVDKALMFWKYRYAEDSRNPISVLLILQRP